MSKTIKDVDQIFWEAVQIEDDERQAAFVRQACDGDDERRILVERLIRAQPRVARFLEQPFELHGTAPTTPTADVPGTQIGPYTLREQLGVGGMGVVFIAEQTTPVKRKVALKIIKPGMDSKQVIARFEAERQALAMMDHPNIARIIDANTTESGRSYFVMELVYGIPITEYCDQHELTNQERLQIFVKACRAVQHAHQKGVIHRDLKPSNVLVGTIDGKAIPKVIDFGVAKAAGAVLTDKTVYTQFSQIIGTPLYMSPEQAELGGTDVDTRSDVYSLGVMLYELLAGRTPFDQDSLKSAGFDEMRRIIREDEPRKPSDMVSTLEAAALSTVSRHRRSDPRKLCVSLTGELDWLVMKTLEKDRNRRYESASAMADDIERYLTGEPIQASPPSVTYRLRKYALRHKTFLITVTAVCLTALLGTVGTSWQAWRATTALTQAKENERAAEANLRLARDAVDEWYIRFGKAWLEDQPGLTEDQRNLLDRATAFYEQIAASGLDADVQLQRAETFRRLATLQFKLGQKEASRKSAHKAIDITEPIVDAIPDTVQPYLLLAESQLVLANQAGIELEYVPELAHRLKALDALDKAPANIRSDSAWRFSRVKVLRQLCDDGWQHGEFSQATAWGNEALELIKELRQASPNDDELLEEHIKALFVLVFIRHERRSPFVFGHSLRPGHDRQETVALYRQAVELATAWYERSPRSVAARDTLTTVAQLPFLLPDDEQERLKLQALESIESLARDFPDYEVYEQSRYMQYHQLAVFYGAKGRFEESLKWIRRGRVTHVDFTRIDLRSLAPFAGGYTAEAEALIQLGRFKEAATAYESAIAVLSQAVQRTRDGTFEVTESWHPRDEHFEQRLAEERASLSQLLDRINQREPTEVLESPEPRSNHD